MRLLLIIAAAATSAALAAEADFSGAEAAPSAGRLAAGDDEARVGCAVRRLLWKEIYALSLYEDPRGSELIVMDVVHDGKMPRGLPDDWPPKLGRTVDADVVGEIDRAFALIEPGSRIEIAYRRAEDASELTIDGQTALSVPERTVYDAIHAMWFGEDPISKKLKRKILTGSSDCAAGEGEAA